MFYVLITFGVSLLSFIPSIGFAQTVPYVDESVIRQAPIQVVEPQIGISPFYLAIFGIIAAIWTVLALLLFVSIFKRLTFFSREDLFCTAWNLTRKNIRFIILLFSAQQAALLIIPSGFQWFFGSIFHIPNTVVVASAVLLGYLLLFLSCFWIINILVQLYDGKTIQRFEFRFSLGQVLSFFTVTVIAVIVSAVGSFFLIIPGVIIGSILSFYPLFIIDRKAGPLQALKASIAITKRKRMDLFLIFISLIAINLVGMAAAIIGLFITIPFSIFVWIGMYRAMLSHARSSAS